MKGEPKLLALDIGSSSVRCRLYGADLRGAECGEGGLRRYGWRTKAGAMEVDAAGLVALVAQAIDAGVARAKESRSDIAGVALTTFWHSLVGLDRSGVPVTPLYGWGDSRATAAAETLRSRLDPRAYHQRTGCFLHASYPAAKLLWLRETDPDAFDHVSVWGSFGAYLEWRLFGSPRCSVSIASGSGLLNARSLTWDEETLEAVGIPAARLAPLVDLDPRRGLRPEWARRWPGLAGAPWFPAVGDGACANVGAGAVGRDRPGITIGTSAAARVVTEAAPGEEVPPDLWCYRLDGRYRTAGSALSNGGNALAFLRATFPQLDFGEVDRALRARAPDSHDLTVVPSLIPDRGPGWTDFEAATVSGLRPGTEPVDVVVAWVEAIGQRLAELIALLESRFGEAVELRATGGALYALPGWLQTIADATGTPVRLAPDREATSRGAAVLAARELGWITSIVIPETETEGGEAAFPRPSHHAIHRAALARQRSLALAIRSARPDTALADTSPHHTQPDLA